jgi:hypothetical protein
MGGMESRDTGTTTSEQPKSRTCTSTWSQSDDVKDAVALPVNQHPLRKALKLLVTDIHHFAACFGL